MIPPAERAYASSPGCPSSWPAEPGERFFSDSEGREWFTIRSADSNGYETVRAYRADDRYTMGYVPGSPDETCYLLVRRPGNAEDLPEPRQVQFRAEQEETAPAVEDADIPEGPDADAEADIPEGPNADEEAVAEISLEGNAVVYRGGIGPKSYERFLAVVRGKEDRIKTIIIESGGGDVIQGMDMGEWIYDNEVDVVVDTLCFSSCANYVFTAAKKKVIRENAIVGWHGSAQQETFIAQSTGKSVDDVYRDMAREFLIEAGEANPTEAQIQAEADIFKEETAADVAREKRFLDKIGLSVNALVYGLMPARYASYVEMGLDGWTFTIADMDKLGIKGVSYAGPGTYPSRAGIESFTVVVFEVE